MICLILLMMLSCQSTNYYEVAGIKNELFTERKGTTINDFVNHRAINRAFDYNLEEQLEKKEEKEVIKMEGDFNSLITTITSAIAGVYCAIKAIIMFIKKIKGK